MSAIRPLDDPWSLTTKYRLRRSWSRQTRLRAPKFEAEAPEDEHAATVDTEPEDRNDEVFHDAREEPRDQLVIHSENALRKDLLECRPLMEFQVKQHIFQQYTRTTHGQDPIDERHEQVSPCWPPKSDSNTSSVLTRSFAQEDVMRTLKELTKPYLSWYAYSLNEYNGAIDQRGALRAGENILKERHERKFARICNKYGSFLYPNAFDVMKELQIQTLINRAHLAYQRGKFNKVLDLSYEALKLAVLLDYEPLMGRCYYWIAAAKRSQGKHRAAARDILRARPCIGKYIEGTKIPDLATAIRKELITMWIDTPRAFEDEHQYWAKLFDERPYNREIESESIAHQQKGRSRIPRPIRKRNPAIHRECDAEPDIARVHENIPGEYAAGDTASRAHSSPTEDELKSTATLNTDMTANMTAKHHSGTAEVNIRTTEANLETTDDGIKITETNGTPSHHLGVMQSRLDAPQPQTSDMSPEAEIGKRRHQQMEREWVRRWDRIVQKGEVSHPLVEAGLPKSQPLPSASGKSTYPTSPDADSPTSSQHACPASRRSSIYRQISHRISLGPRSGGSSRSPSTARRSAEVRHRIYTLQNPGRDVKQYKCDNCTSWASSPSVVSPQLRDRILSARRSGGMGSLSKNIQGIGLEIDGKNSGKRRSEFTKDTMSEGATVEATETAKKIIAEHIITETDEKWRQYSHHRNSQGSPVGIWRIHGSPSQLSGKKRPTPFDRSTSIQSNGSWRRAGSSSPSRSQSRPPSRPSSAGSYKHEVQTRSLLGMVLPDPQQDSLQSHMLVHQQAPSKSLIFEDSSKQAQISIMSKEEAKSIEALAPENTPYGLENVGSSGVCVKSPLGDPSKSLHDDSNTADTQSGYNKSTALFAAALLQDHKPCGTELESSLEQGGLQKKLSLSLPKVKDENPENIRTPHALQKDGIGASASTTGSTHTDGNKSQGTMKLRSGSSRHSSKSLSISAPIPLISSSTHSFLTPLNADLHDSSASLPLVPAINQRRQLSKGISRELSPFSSAGRRRSSTRDAQSTHLLPGVKDPAESLVPGRLHPSRRQNLRIKTTLPPHLSRSNLSTASTAVGAFPSPTSNSPRSSISPAVSSSASADNFLYLQHPAPPRRRSIFNDTHLSRHHSPTSTCQYRAEPLLSGTAAVTANALGRRTKSADIHSGSPGLFGFVDQTDSNEATKQGGEDRDSQLVERSRPPSRELMLEFLREQISKDPQLQDVNYARDLPAQIRASIHTRARTSTSNNETTQRTFPEPSPSQSSTPSPGTSKSSSALTALYDIPLPPLAAASPVTSDTSPLKLTSSSPSLTLAAPHDIPLPPSASASPSTPIPHPMNPSSHTSPSKAPPLAHTPKPQNATLPSSNPSLSPLTSPRPGSLPSPSPSTAIRSPPPPPPPQQQNPSNKQVHNWMQKVRSETGIEMTGKETKAEQGTEVVEEQEEQEEKINGDEDEDEDDGFGDMYAA